MSNKKISQLQEGVPLSTDVFPYVDLTSNTTKKSLISSISGGGGVTSLNTLTGAITISAGSNITLTPTGNDIEISATGGGGTPASPDTSIQFNNLGAFGGDAKLTWDAVNSNLLFNYPTVGVAIVGQDGGSGQAGTNVEMDGGNGGLNAQGGYSGLAAGAGNGNMAGGEAFLEAGNGGDTGNGGIVTILAGDGGATSGDGGRITITTGSPQGSGVSGDLVLTYFNSNPGMTFSGTTSVVTVDGDSHVFELQGLSSETDASQDGAFIALTGGNADVHDVGTQGGNIELLAGRGTGDELSLNAYGASLTLHGGNVSSNGNGGSASLNGGYAFSGGGDAGFSSIVSGTSTDGDGGDCEMSMGTGNATTGKDGRFQIHGQRTNGARVYRIAGSISTTDATPTSAHQAISPALSSGQSMIIETKVVARRTGGSSGTSGDSASYIRRACYKNTGAGPTIVGAIQDSFTVEDQAGWDCSFTVSGNDVLVQVTGATNNNVRWYFEIMYIIN